MDQRKDELEAELGEPITFDGLSATFKIFQRRKGHRHSTDDLLTAWYALEQRQPDSALDLGTGIGTVGLLMASALPALHLTCIEAQDISFRFLRENIAVNQVGDRVRSIHGDLRELALDEKFPLITGSPPYFDPRAGIVPADSQKAHARFELRGDVTDYARAAKAHLEPDGLFVFCFPFAQADPRRRRCACRGLLDRDAPRCRAARGPHAAVLLVRVPVWDISRARRAGVHRSRYGRRAHPDVPCRASTIRLGVDSRRGRHACSPSTPHS